MVPYVVDRSPLLTWWSLCPPYNAHTNSSHFYEAYQSTYLSEYCIRILFRPPSSCWGHCSLSHKLSSIEALATNNMAHICQRLHKRDQALGHRMHWKELLLYSTTCSSNDVLSPSASFYLLYWSQFVSASHHQPSRPKAWTHEVFFFSQLLQT